MKNFRKNLATNISLIVVLAFTAIHLLLLTLNVFGVTSIKLYDGFNYFIAYILIIISLTLYILGFFIEKITKLVIPSWFEILFFIAFFLFTNTYYILNAYSNIFAMLIFYCYISVLITIANISVFYHVQKDENNKLKASKNYIVTSIFFYSVATNGIFELIVTALKVFAFASHPLTTLTAFVVDFSAMILVSIVMSFALHLSLSKSKRFINACLIKTK